MATESGYLAAMPTNLQTAEDLLQFRDPRRTAELVRGVLIVREPPATRHGELAARLLIELGTFARQGNLGTVFAQDTGFKIGRDPDTVRAPDVGFVARGRLHLIGEGYAEVAPDLVAEILSPTDRPGEVLDKIGQWLSAGTRLVWVVDPARRRAHVYRADGSVSVLSEAETLDGEDVVPGFRCGLRDLM